MQDALWKPSIHAADALDRDRFTIAIGELEYDDPFMAILSFDGRFPQPWQRTDVQREIADIKYAQFNYAEPFPIALSNEADIYTLRPTGTDVTKIPSAGLLSEDADGRGNVYTLVVDGTVQHVLGRSRQLYRRDALAAWETLSVDPSRPAGYEQEDFGWCVALMDGSLVLESGQRPYTRPDPETLTTEFWENMSEEDFNKHMDREMAAVRSAAPHITRLYHYTEGNFIRLDVPEDIKIHDIYLDPDNKVWLTGLDGLIMRGTPETGFERLDFHGDTELIHSITRFKGEMICAWGYGLYRFDGHRVIPLKPKLNDPFRNQNTPTPMKLQTVGTGDDAVMFYFDYKHGVCRWDGETWDWIDIPPELLKREFKGLDR